MIEKQLMGIVFADVKGFGSLTEAEVVRFSTRILPDCIRLARRRRAAYINTWGDAIVGFFRGLSDALEYAFDLRDYFRNKDWASGKDNGYRVELKVRISLHAADVFISTSKGVPGGKLFGSQVSLAARIEPIATPNEVFASESAVSIIKAQGAPTFLFKDLGVLNLPKENRRERIHWVRRRGEVGILKNRALTSSTVRCLNGTDEAMLEISRTVHKAKIVKILALNGGSSMHFLLEVLRSRISPSAEIKILTYDPNCANLRSRHLIDGTDRDYLDKLQSIVSENQTTAMAACEYFMQASELAAWTNESQQAQSDRLRERLSNFVEGLKRSKVHVTLRRSPRWTIGRTWLIGDYAYFTIYTQPHKLSPVLVSERGNELFEALERHFDYIWDELQSVPNSLLFEARS